MCTRSLEISYHRKPWKKGVLAIVAMKIVKKLRYFTQVNQYLITQCFLMRYGLEQKRR